MLNWEWYDDINTKVVFLHLLLTSNYADKTWHGILIKRGQRISSYGKLAKETKLSVKSVRTAINHLKRTGEVAHETTSEYSLFTVINYDKYQEGASETASEGQTKGKPRASEGQQRKKDKKDKKDKEIKDILHGAETTPCSIPPIIELILNTKEEYPIYQNQVDKWSELYPAVDILQELKKMKGWLEANPSKRKAKSGILRFITNWLAKEQDRGKRPSQVNTYQKSDKSNRNNFEQREYDDDLFKNW